MLTQFKILCLLREQSKWLTTREIMHLLHMNHTNLTNRANISKKLKQLVKFHFVERSKLSCNGDTDTIDNGGWGHTYLYRALK